MVTIVSDDASGNGGLQSWFQSAIMAGTSSALSSFQYPDFAEENDLSIKVCSKQSGTPDLVFVGIYLVDGRQSHTCRSI
jgi:hypothetical protein